MYLVKPRVKNSLRLNCGVSLIEILVSIVITSIGLLALAGVNASSIRYSKMTQYRGTATQLSNDIGERMRANKAGLPSYTLASSFTDQSTLPTLAAADLCNSYLVACTSDMVANFDLKSWQILVRDQLPEGAAYISIQAAQNAADLWLAWRDPSIADNDTAPTVLNECPAGLVVSPGASIRCSYFRINL